MTKPPKVSVVMITYNHEHFIAEAIQGVLMQEFDFTIEFIISNDKSTDRTHDVVIEELLEKKVNPEHIQIRYYNHKENKGMMPNFTWTLRQAKGKYIALCEGDDYWTDPLKLQKQVDFLEENKDYALHCTNALILDGKKQTPTQNDPVSFNEFDILNKNFTYTASLSFRKEDILIPNFIEKSPAGDWLLILYALRKKKGYFSKEVTCVYRIHEGGIWSQLEKQNKTAIKKRFENLKANAVINQHISKDKVFNNQVRSLAAQKQESYAYQAKRMAILYPFLSFNTNDLEPKSLASVAKLNLTRLKKVFN